jgi:mannose-6-phosphate isomerase-like protein (cupin superfamily)
MRYFIDLDGTLCTKCAAGAGDYSAAEPIWHRIQNVNRLYNDGHHITIWTARGAVSGVDYRELTATQLFDWGVLYHELSMGEKPSYDVLIDDKCFNVDAVWKTPAPDAPSKKFAPQFVEKEWGREIIFANQNKYCGKILHFARAGYMGSMHYHLCKDETWYVSSGTFLLSWINPATGQTTTEYLRTGDCVRHFPTEAHQLIAIEDNSMIFEVSTQHFDEDTYRISPSGSVAPL